MLEDSLSQPTAPEQHVPILIMPDPAAEPQGPVLVQPAPTPEPPVDTTPATSSGPSEVYYGQLNDRMK